LSTDPVTTPSDPRASSSTARTDTPQNTEEGYVLAPDELAEYEQLRKLVSREQSLTLLDDFAKWLFPTAAAVGTLGASFGASDANSLSGAGRTLFSLAVAAVGVSLALAAFARLPLRKRVYLYSRESMASHVDRVVVVRGVLLTAAAVLFSGGLVLAGLSPLFS
jgi:hypothetical protein